MRALRVGAALSVAAGIFLASNSARVQGQAASPSVREAARLKHRPPPNWIQHYLGDDRYKIAGGAWRVVSTETDTFYDPAWAPEMLRQSNAIVIGFPSSAAAEEAGYKRSKYPMDSPLLGLTGRPAPTPVPVPVAPSAPAAPGNPLGGFALPTGATGGQINRSKARRIVLADGASTAILPPGWSHVAQDQPVPQNAGGRGPQQMKLSIFAPGVITNQTIAPTSTARMVVFGFMDLPPGMRGEVLFNASTMSRLAARGRAGRVDSSAPSGMGGLNGMSPARFGNVSGISIPYPVPNLGTVKLNIAGRGSKAFILVDVSRGARGARQIITSFKGG